MLRVPCGQTTPCLPAAGNQGLATRVVVYAETLTLPDSDCNARRKDDSRVDVVATVLYLDYLRCGRLLACNSDVGWLGCFLIRRFKLQRSEGLGRKGDNQRTISDRGYSSMVSKCQAAAVMLRWAA
jgi:hypothetical protein